MYASLSDGIIASIVSEIRCASAVCNCISQAKLALSLSWYVTCPILVVFVLVRHFSHPHVTLSQFWDGKRYGVLLSSVLIHFPAVLRRPRRGLAFLPVSVVSAAMPKRDGVKDTSAPGNFVQKMRKSLQTKEKPQLRTKGRKSGDSSRRVGVQVKDGSEASRPNYSPLGGHSNRPA